MSTEVFPALRDLGLSRSVGFFLTNVSLCVITSHKEPRRFGGSKARLENKRGGEDSGEQIKAPGAAGEAAGENQTFGVNFFTMVRDQRQRPECVPAQQ